MREIHNQETVEWNSEHTDSVKDRSEEEDLLQADEFLEDQKGVILHELALESVMDPMIKRANAKIVEDGPTTDDTVTAEDSLRTDSSLLLREREKISIVIGVKCPPMEKGHSLAGVNFCKDHFASSALCFLAISPIYRYVDLKYHT
ncbi:hypothetical protein N7536_004088 [Penicillium majusculum]|uniref:Uncharacterized protein n=1 Tax=Penicillium solitum TaxID=60172 RepID=A0A1V6QJF4_9EURO|nr:uncharacterized protein PENSOL_c068G08115 [Penicillium solitum]KAJ5693676.1 hypothetical protein N7536_004088 [Penicillium majusculum]OQD89122.1 hypothetical protein PENSOL_c068G08115 [Penicillium solitum]